MNQEPIFPKYGTAQAARSHGCFQCLSVFTDDQHIKTEYPPGRGQYRLTCSACGMSTWFDVEGEE